MNQMTFWCSWTGHVSNQSQIGGSHSQSSDQRVSSLTQMRCLDRFIHMYLSPTSDSALSRHRCGRRNFPRNPRRNGQLINLSCQRIGWIANLYKQIYEYFRYTPCQSVCLPESRPRIQIEEKPAKADGGTSGGETSTGLSPECCCITRFVYRIRIEQIAGEQCDPS